MNKIINKPKCHDFQYQLNAIDFAINWLTEQDSNGYCKKEFCLQSPTGSGKTLIIAKLISKIIENQLLNSSPLTFIFISPSTGGLEYQGYEKLKKYLNNNWVNGYDVEYIGTN